MLSDRGSAELIGPDGEIQAPAKVELPAHSGRIIRCQAAPAASLTRN
jgi:hypothetical protein